MSKIIVLSGAYHFGDNIGIFQSSSFVGHTLELPLRKTWVDPNATTVAFIFETHDIETWGNWNGHIVSINGKEIGRLKDSSNNSGRKELITIELNTQKFEELLAGNNNFTLQVSLERQSGSAAGMSDDFVLARIDTKNFVARVGWA